MVRRRGMVPFLAVIGALAWSVGFALWAFLGSAGTECVATATAETCRSTPLAGRLWPEILPVMAPAAVCLAVWWLLHRYCSRGGRAALGVAVALASLSAAFCVLAALSVGPLVAPVALLLIVAVTATTPPASSQAV